MHMDCSNRRKKCILYILALRLLLDVLLLIAGLWCAGRYQALPIEEQQRLDAERGMRP